MLETLAADARVTVRTAGAHDPEGRAVVYWMQRAQRAEDNPALDVAIDAGNALGLPVVVFLGVVPFYPHGNLRHYRFLADGLADLAEGLRARRVGFVLRAWPAHRLEPFVEEVKAALVIGDENPLREAEGWRRTLAGRLRVPLWTVDADVVVPSKLLVKEQYAARTIRPRLHALFDRFLVAGKEPVARRAFRAPHGLSRLDPRDDILDGLPIDRSIAPVAGARGGTRAGRAQLQRFLRAHLAGYDRQRNRPELDATSRLSAYLHFGHLGPRALALAVRDVEAPKADRDAFLEQLIVRRELAINFVRYNPRYDTLASCEPWALRTLREHARDRRHLVDERALEAADSPDPLWNAAQAQMLTQGFMHNYLRMYWAKRLLEWCATPEEAYALAVRLNDRWELDGRDPNGYAGIAWAIGGKHDRAWPERPVFGKVRYMSPRATGRKFDSVRYAAEVRGGGPLGFRFDGGARGEGASR